MQDNFKKILRPTKEIPVFSSRIGSDESGKGDFFGPLVVAAVYLDDRCEKSIAHLDITDSKKHTDSVNKNLKNKLLEILSTSSYSIKVIRPAEFNSLYSIYKNLNIILTLAHSSVIKDLLLKNKNCKNVIVDQFSNENRILNEFKDIDVNIYQTPKAERDKAVAAASIIARATLLDEFKMMSDKLYIKIPFGASKNVDECAISIKNKIGVKNLNNFVKLCFKNYNRVVSG